MRTDTPKTTALDDDHEFDSDDGDGDEWGNDCGLMSDGQCTMAGSEHCDFSCPNRNSEHIVGSRAWCRKHGEPYP